ncbi:MAG TPA: hypothetical protein VNN79_08440 [Actinomycetota bacterium]|nr:hypothetical protein [Actinomycetota bacterium]
MTGHSDAHEQAKWFGDDIAFTSEKYDYELRSIRRALSGMRKLGPGNSMRSWPSGSGSPTPCRTPPSTSRCRRRRSSCSPR